MWKTQSQERHWFHDVLNLYPPSMVHKASSEPRRQRAHNASDFDLSIVWVLLRFSRSCVYACGCAYMYVCMCVHIRLTGKGVAGRDWRQNTGNATMTMAAWIGRNGVYDNRKGIERGRNSISLSLAFQRSHYGSSSFLLPPTPVSHPRPLLNTPFWNRFSRDCRSLVNARVCSMRYWILSLSGASQPFLPSLRFHVFPPSSTPVYVGKYHTYRLGWDFGVNLW